MIPSLREAAADPMIDGSTAKVLVYLATGPLENPQQYVPVKVSSLAHDLKMKDVTVWRALNRLVDCGYLRRSGTERVRTYQLVYARVA